MKARKGVAMINMSHFLDRSTVNGPGVRCVVWVQGCPFRCPGCFNPDQLPFRGATLVSGEDLLAKILAVHAESPIDGVTFTGGEPFSQGAELAWVAERLRKDGFSVVVFTGFTMEEIFRLKENTALVYVTDLIVAGRYDEAQKLAVPELRGSANKDIRYLTDKLKPGKLSAAELIIGTDGTITLTGFPNEALRRVIEGLGQEER